MKQFIEKLADLTVKNPSFFNEVILVLAVLALSFGVSYYFKNIIANKIEESLPKRTAERTSDLIQEYLNPLFNPLLTIILLSATYFLHKVLTGSAEFLLIVTELASVWLIINVVRVFSSSAILAWIVGFFLVSMTILKTFELLDYTMEVLDSAGLTIGTFKITIFMLLKAVLSTAVILWITSAILNFGHSAITTTKMRLTTKALTNKIFDIVIYFIAFIIVMNFLQIDLTAFAVIGGAVGVGLGIGLQKIAANFISGFILLFEGLIQIGDLVELDDGSFGYVRKMSARGTVVEGFNGREVIIPNEDFITKKVINWTHTSKKGRVDIEVGVAYGCDLRKVKDLLLKAATMYEGCIEKPEPACHVTKFDNSSVNYILFFWVKDVSEGRFGPKSEVMMNIWNLFQENDIEIPYPKVENFIKEMPINSENK